LPLLILFLLLHYPLDSDHSPFTHKHITSNLQIRDTAYLFCIDASDNSAIGDEMATIRLASNLKDGSITKYVYDKAGARLVKVADE
jgi:hypothetical protein